jgi:fatty aldehyde-generating acyl-ACP reductase
MGKNLKNAEVLVIGASGSIGNVCAQILARDCKYMTLAGRQTSKLEKVADKILKDTGLSVKITSNVKNAVKKADVYYTVTSSMMQL